MNIHETTYTCGDIVYLKTDESQRERMVTMVRISHLGTTYELSCGTEASAHHEIEIDGVENESVKLGIKQMSR